MNAQSRKAFLEDRQTSIGGSDIAAILGMSKFSTPYDIWRSKVEPVEEEDESEKPYLYWGSVLEDVVAKEYALRTGYKIQRVNKKLVHPKHAFIAANIDRAVVNPEIAGNVRWKGDRLTTDKILECKTSNAFAAGDWGDSGTDDVPLYYLIQCQWYLGVTGAETADLAVLIGGSDYRTYTIRKHDDLIGDLQEAAFDFWTNHVQSGIAPDPQTVADAQHRWPRHLTDKSVIVDVAVANACRELAVIKEKEKELKKLEEAAKLTIMSAAGDAETITHGGETFATWKAQTATRLDSKALKADQPALFDLYSKETTSRVLRLSKAAKEQA